MTDETISADPAYVRRTAFGEGMPPPASDYGFTATVRKNLFATWPSALMTLAALALILWVLPGLLRFLVFDAVWSAADGAPCRAPGAGACWPFIARKLPYFVYGAYPIDQRWRVNLTLAIAGVLIVWLLWLSLPRRRVAAMLFFFVFPVVGFVLLHGWPALGLRNVTTDLWGGVFVSLLVATVGIVVSLPVGVLLALGRRSSLPGVRLFCIGYIELVRGVPLITVLFMANTMLPLFVPDYLQPDRLLRPLIGVAMFASAYMAEEVRGGLQAMPKGQLEAANALGLRTWQGLRLVVLPQALRLVIPGIVNTFIGLFKDTTLVAVVGIFDFLRTIETARLDPEWAGPTTSQTGYAFAAIFYFVFCFGMSRYSLFVERRLARDRRK